MGVAVAASQQNIALIQASLLGLAIIRDLAINHLHLLHCRRADQPCSGPSCCLLSPSCCPLIVLVFSSKLCTPIPLAAQHRATLIPLLQPVQGNTRVLVWSKTDDEDFTEYGGWPIKAVPGPCEPCYAPFHHVCCAPSSPCMLCTFLHHAGCAPFFSMHPVCLSPPYMHLSFLHHAGCAPFFSMLCSLPHHNVPTISPGIVPACGSTSQPWWGA